MPSASLSAPVEAINARFAVALGERELADVLEHEVVAAGRGQRRGEPPPPVRHARWGHRLDARGTRDARSEIIVASHDRIESAEDRPRVKRDADMARVGK